MTLYTVTQPDPPAGTDFSFTVPGRYLYDVTGITATLATGTPGGKFYGVSYDGTSGVATFYLNGVAVGTAANPPLPTALAPNTLNFGNPVNGPVIWDEQAFFNHTLSPADMAAMFAAASTSYPAYAAAVLARSPVAYYHLDPFPAPGAVCADSSGNGNDLTYQSNTGLFPMVPVPGLVAGNGAIEVTGTQVAIGPVAGVGTGSFSQVGWVDPEGAPNAMLLGFIQFNPGGETMWVLQALNQPGQPLMTLLRVVQVGPTIIQTFDAPVGTFSPSGGTGRQPSLIVTNGTTELVAVPSGFPAVATPGPYEYSWQPALNADVQSTDGTLTTVAIPQLLLPAGYTVGPRTLDIQPTDQWSNVALWWDDAYQLQLDPYGNYLFGGGIHLTYHQIGT